MRRTGTIILAALLVAGCATDPKPHATPAPPAAAAATPPRDSQYLYGSAEALAISRQAYAALTDHVRRTLAAGAPKMSVMADPASPLDTPRFLPCDGKPPAAVFDMDETSILNIGAQYHEARAGGGSFDKARWDRWQRADETHAIAAVPGAAEAFRALREMGVTVIVNTNRDAFAADSSIAALSAAGLGRFVHQQSLWLAGDLPEPNRGGKDARRMEIMKTHCIVAMAGDQLVDFSDRFIGSDAGPRRAAADHAYGGLWGHGWFVLPNPVYGSGVQGNWDQVFPPTTRWDDPGPARP